MTQVLPDDYGQLLTDLKATIRQTRLRAIVVANAELLRLYWQIGKAILERQETAQWGSKVIEKLADDLRSDFPDMQGLSRRNLFYMRKFAEAYPTTGEFVQRAVAQLPWAHHVILLDKVKSAEIRDFYIAKALEYGWSRDILSLQIKSGLHERQGKAIITTALNERLWKKRKMTTA